MTIKGRYHGPELDAIGWYGGNSGGVAYAGAFDCDTSAESQYPTRKKCGTHPVAGRRPNAWGLYDMLGNVSEWTGDWIGPYDLATESDPSGPNDGHLLDDGLGDLAKHRVNRGGFWGGYARWGRAAFRMGSRPDERNRFFGFRLVRRP